MKNIFKVENQRVKEGQTWPSGPERTLLHADSRTEFGFWVYLMTDCILFAGLFATFAVLRGATVGGVSIADITNLPFVLIETMLLLTSSFAAGLAMLAAHAKKKNLTLYALFATLVLGLAFLGMELSEFSHLVAEGSGPQSAFLSSFFALVGTHGLHVFIGSVWMLSLMGYIAARGLTQGNIRKLVCLAMFWHFLDLIWIFIFTFVYMFGAI